LLGVYDSVMSSSELFRRKAVDPDGETASERALVSVFNFVRSVSLIRSSWLDVRLFLELIE